MPPVSPGFVVPASVDELRNLLTSCTGGSVRAHLPTGVHWGLGGQPLSVSQCDAIVDGGRSVTNGGHDFATLDGGGMSRIFDVASGAHLKLQRLRLINGFAEAGGSIQVLGASVEVEHITVQNSKAWGGSGGFVSASQGAVTMKMLESYGTSAAAHGGLVYGEASAVTMLDVNATESKAEGGYGGYTILVLTYLLTCLLTLVTYWLAGVLNVFSSSLTLANIRTVNTSSAMYGGVANIGQDSIATVSNVVSINTFALLGGGFAAVVVDTIATMTDINVTNSVGGLEGEVGGGGLIIVTGASVLTLSNVFADGTTTFAEPGGGFAFIYKAHLLLTLLSKYYPLLTTASIYSRKCSLPIAHYTSCQATASMTNINVVNAYSAITGAVFNLLGSTVTVTDLSATNATSRKGGLAFSSGSTLEMKNVRATHMAASLDGGLVNLQGSSCTMTNVFATHASAGIKTLEASWSGGNGNTFTSASTNTASGSSAVTTGGGNGGLVFSQGSVLSMTRVVAENTVAAFDGGLLYLDAESTTHATEVEATLTSAGRDGGLLYIAAESTFQANGIKALNTMAGRAGGLISATKYAVLHASGVVTEQTSAGQDGGLIHANDGCTIEMNNVVALDTSAERDGGFVHSSASCTVKMDGVAATSTSAGQHGGFIDAGDGSKVEIANSVATGTSAGKHGGLIHAPDGAALVHLTNVTAKTVTAVTSAGLALLGAQATLVLQSSRFFDVFAASAPIAAMDSGAQFQTLHAAIGVGCDAQQASTLAPYIVSNGSGVAGGLALRDMQIDDTCSTSPAVRANLMSQIAGALVVCAQKTYTDATTGLNVPICGPATECTDTPVLEGSSTTSPQCACASGALRTSAVVLGERGALSESAPYLAGDFCECARGEP